jgi:uncharacterized 2Fe-2S/4Fe-4S cluster protein (DUF4445 family)
MRELFAGHPVAGLAKSPFVPSSPGAILSPPDNFGMEIHPSGVVYAPPLLGHFVGADTLAGILATGIAEEDRHVMLVDIGTNTEIALGNSERILVASCASGPAFEGSGVKCGTGAIPGAVRSVRIGEDGRVMFETIDALPPSGICGSGIIDAIARMRESGVLAESGHFTGPGQRFVIWPGDPPVFLDGEDIDAVKLAKAAISAGTRVVLEKYGARASDIRCLYLAGAFGASLDQVSACTIGMIPDLPPERIITAGNAAIEGAVRILVSEEVRLEGEAIPPIITHVSLEREPRFGDIFVEELVFDRWAV